MAGEKTEQATSKRKKDEREKGNIFMSREIVSVGSLVVMFTSLNFLLPTAFFSLGTFMEKYFSIGAIQDTLETKEILNIFIECSVVYAKAAMPFLLISIVTAMATTMLQTRMLYSTKSLQFKGERINPISGIKKMFSMRSIVELIKSILKISLLIYIIYYVMKDRIIMLPKLISSSPLSAMAFTGANIMQIIILSGIAFSFIAVADYIYQWWQYEKNLRMSKQDIKDEYKQMEGDPQVKGQIKAMQRERSRRRMMQNVQHADVVIRNPTHFAVAIKYDKDRAEAPIVVAKGADNLALRIIAEAEKHGVYVTENRPLARALYETVEIDSQIPAEHYKAIAEILAFIYSLNKKELN